MDSSDTRTVMVDYYEVYHELLELWRAANRLPNIERFDSHHGLRQPRI